MKTIQNTISTVGDVHGNCVPRQGGEVYFDCGLIQQQGEM